VEVNLASNSQMLDEIPSRPKTAFSLHEIAQIAGNRAAFFSPQKGIVNRPNLRETAQSGSPEVSLEVVCRAHILRNAIILKFMTVKTFVFATFC